MDKPTILVIEDESAIRTGICDVLVFKGYAPTGIERGRIGSTYTPLVEGGVMNFQSLCV
jgi:DNA-binding response OmpR family regulator